MKRVTQYALSVATALLAAGTMAGVVSAKTTSILSATTRPLASSTITVTWAKPSGKTNTKRNMATAKPKSKPKTALLTLISNPSIQAVGSQAALTVTVPPNPSRGTFRTGEFIEIYDKTTGAIVSSHAVQRDTYTTIDKSNAAGSQTFVARLWNAGVTPRTNPPSLTSNTLTVTWIKSPITASPSPMSNVSGKAYQIAYSTAALPSGDYVTITDTSGRNTWSVKPSSNK